MSVLDSLSLTALKNAWTPTTLFATAVCSVLLTLAVSYSSLPKQSKDSIYHLGGFSILTAWPFFTKRNDFLWENFKKTGQCLFQFNVLQHRVVAVSGEEGRRVFFNDKNLDFNEGYKILMGGAPRMEEIDIAVEHADSSNNAAFIQRLLQLLNRKRLDEQIGTLFEDMDQRMQEWGIEGQINPFKNVYDLVFQMTVRMATCRSLATNRSEVTRLAELYWGIEKSATPVKLLLPWFPSKAKKESERCTRELYGMLYGYVEDRRKAPEGLGSDAIDVMISQGLENPDIIQFVLGVVFAGVINTGINSCWILLFLGANPEWKAKLTSEFHSLLSTYGTSTSATDPLHARLSSIPVSAWEDSTPISEAVIRETLRLITNGTLLRRNVNNANLVIDGKKVDQGSFLAYNLGDVHLKEEIYQDVERFDPGRFEKGQGKEGALTFLGWGAGRHPCAGMKVAKLEIKMIIALFVLGYEYELVDKSGKFPKALPKPDRNDLQQARPVGEPCFLKFKKVVN